MEENEFNAGYFYKKVDKIVFGMQSPKTIKKMSAVKIVTPELYDKEGYPVDGGLMDTRMGVIDPGLRCKTCGSSLKECTGHFGYIELARPVLHITYIKPVYTSLKTTCRSCGRLLLEPKKIAYFKARLKKMQDLSDTDGARKVIAEVLSATKKNSKCPHCKAKQMKIIIEKPTTFIEDEKRISPIEIRIRLEKITDDDCELIGFNPAYARPEWMVLTLFPIPPVTMRPSITLESGERSEDDLTHKLGDIVRINQRLYENINAGAPEIIVEDLWDLLQYHITTFFDNNIAQLPPARHRSGQPLKTLTDRIKSKEGRLRHNLAGKRTNFSARTVISPDPSLDLDEVGVPESIAMKLTIPERVTTWNMEYLKKFVQSGPSAKLGANYILRPDGKKKKITDETKEELLEEIQPGYIVERHLMDGDLAIFNRQPSLHRMSMMCHRIRVLPYQTFRLNPAVCHPYNADFDGDEMNLHIPQTEEARAEAEILMEVKTQMISPRYGLSVIGCVQDAISGNYLLTKRMKISRERAIELLFSSGVEDFSRLPRKSEVTGKEIFSQVLPADFSFEGTSRLCKHHEKCMKEKCRDEGYVMIKDGNLVCGVMDKNNLGEESGLLLGELRKKYGEEAIKILEKIFKLGVLSLNVNGLSSIISDVDLSSNVKAEVKKILDKANADVDVLIQSYRQGALVANPGITIAETLERKISEILNKARNEIGKIVLEASEKESDTMLMIRSGARGNFLNMAQMSACVGQQSLRGGRIDSGYEGRTLSSYKRNDLTGEAHGFVKHGFKEGLSPQEFFFMGVTGRDSLMDTALRTPKSGYLYRRLANAMQDLKVAYDNTVRDSNNRIIQFKYGEDSIDVSKSVGGKIDIKKIVESN
ncbi:MAG: DNA-directed RNA polymerase subunit A' [Candidatus Woesearchaeota archaeon]|nr:DNA-directed RNA polymerase subunit A' [Candidatus Woesearchaeota archaeon]